jgi:uncharacterized cupredoxin-like copper-binding protein
MYRHRKRVLASALMLGLAAGTGGLPVQHAAGKTVQQKVTAKEFAFTPKAITVDDGTVQFVVTNAGATEHTFVIDALGVKSRPIRPAETVVLTATALKGTYVIYCDIPGHKEAGMVATLAVR